MDQFFRYTSTVRVMLQALALVMGVMLFYAPVMVNSITKKAIVEECDNIPRPITEEEVVHGAKVIPDKVGTCLDIACIVQGSFEPHGPEMLLLDYHRDVPDPPPWG